jgi:hypothetical protein
MRRLLTMARDPHHVGTPVRVGLLRKTSPFPANEPSLTTLAEKKLAKVELSSTLAISGWIASGLGEAFENVVRDFCEIVGGPGS